MMMSDDLDDFLLAPEADGGFATEAIVVMGDGEDWESFGRNRQKPHGERNGWNRKIGFRWRAGIQNLGGHGGKVYS